MIDLTPFEYRALLRQDFHTFAQRCFHQLNPQTGFLPNWHIEVMAAKLDACRRAEIKRLIVNVPPRSLKSLLASVALPAWYLGHDPSAQILCVSYAQDLSDKLARDCRSVVTNSWYQALFPTRLSTQRQAVQEFVTSANGYRIATSVGGVLTGRGADLIIIDDPLKPEEALSEARRKSVNEWYDNTLFSRLNDKRRGCIIVIMQRLHEDDLVGHVLEQEKWEVLRFPAIAEQDEEYVIDTPLGNRRFRRRTGELLHPEREPPETIERIRSTLGEFNFAGQYQQAPAPLGGGLIKIEWFNTYEPGELPERFDQVVQSWDTANKPTELSDYSVCTTWGLRGRRIYLLHVARQRLDYPQLKRRVREQADAFRATVVIVEDKASGTQLIQELVSDGLRQVKRFQPETDKVMRMHAQTATIENGFVYLPREAPWLADYLHELRTFPNGKYDDQADSTSQALDWIKRGLKEPNAIAWGRQELARMLHRQGTHLSEIARRVEATTEQVQQWISYDPVKAGRAIWEASRRRISQK
jgi:predicted phage terminase large subunit-like protein